MKRKKFTKEAVVKDLKKNKIVYLMAMPGIIFFLIFSYWPMAGLWMAFTDFKIKNGIFGSPFVGLQHFKDFFESIYFSRVVINTIAISGLQLLITFPAAIVFALLLNEISRPVFKRSVQTISYMPHFISMVVMAGILIDFSSTQGILSRIVFFFTGESVNLLSKANYWRPLYILSDLWQELGFSAIIYLAALAGVDGQLYDAAKVDGANRWQQTWHVTLPGISTTIIIMLILKIGNIMGVGYEKTILLYNNSIYSTADIIASYVYRKGLEEANYGFSTAVSLFNSVINFALILVANRISRKFSETSLF